MMNDEELQVLITLDDPVEAPEEDIFHLQAEHALDCWPGQPCEVEQTASDDDTDVGSEA
jgi:hypothetical protein